MFTSFDFKIYTSVANGIRDIVNYSVISAVWCINGDFCTLNEDQKKTKNS